MTARKRRTKADDPFLRACGACGAGVNDPCRTVGRDSIPLVPKKGRLVHLARLEGKTTDA